MRVRRALWLALPWAYVLACGGRFEKTVEGDDQPSAGTSSTIGGTSSTSGSTGKAGSASKAGSSTSGGSTGRAGSTSVGGRAGAGGTTSFAGTFGIAGTFATGGGCACDAIACASPFRAVPNADGCCFHCELDLMACYQAEQGYQAYRAQVIEKYQTLGCKLDSDCGLIYDKNECGAASCGAPLLSSQIAVVTQMLDAYAQANCSFACPPEPIPPCGARPAPSCVMNRCQ